MNPDHRFTVSGETNISDATDKILEEFAPKLEEAIYASKLSKGVKHHRKFKPTRNRVKLTRRGGIIHVMSIGTNKGEIMSHKGKGGRGQDKRIEKKFINEPGQPLLEELADRIAESTGDIVAFKLVQ